MTMREEVAYLLDQGLSDDQIIAKVRENHAPTPIKAHRVREYIAILRGPEAWQQFIDERMARKVGRVPPPPPPAPVAPIEEPKDTIRRTYKEVRVGAIGTEATSERQGGGLRIIMISLPYVAWLHRPEI